MPKMVPLTAAHLSAVEVIEKACHAFPWSTQTLVSNFGNRYFNFVFVLDDEVIGYYFANQVAGEASLLNIAISPCQQGKGYGKLLLNHLISQCQAQDIFQLWLEVRESNHNAYQLYLAAGFNEVDRRTGYYPTVNGREDAIMMCYIV